MIKSSIELLASDIGFDYGNSCDVTQSNLLNGMGRAFQTYPKDNLDMQMCYLSQKLTPQAESWILQLAGFIELNREKL